MILDEHHTWKSHISYVSNKISKSIGIIRKSSYFLLEQSLLTLYYSMVYPYLHYCNIVWASTYASNLFRLVLLQKHTVRILNNSTFDSHTSEIFRNLRLLKFHDICKLQTAQFMFLYENNFLPDHFEGLFLLKNEFHRYYTRNVKEFYIATPRTNVRQFSIKYQGPILYNNLDNSIVNSVSFSSFTKRLKLFLP